MASLTAEPTEIEPGTPHGGGGAPRSWALLDRLEHTTLGTRDADGTTRVGRKEVAGCILYGPYWHFETGRYRLAIAATAGSPALADQPVLGIEIIVLSRLQRAWRDFTAAELADGAGTLVFDVPPELAVDGGNEARFEFRVFHLGNADLVIRAIRVESLPDDTEVSPHPRRWRLLGRLHKTWLGRRRQSGVVTAAEGLGAGLLLYGGWPYVRLGRGSYRLTIHGAAGSPRLPAQPVLGVEVLGRSRWYTDNPWQQWRRAPKPGGTREAWADFRVDEWVGGAVTLDFAVPTPMALEAGADAPFDIRLHQFGNAGLTIDDVELCWLGEEDAQPASDRWRLLGRLRKARIGAEDATGVSVSANELPGPLLAKIRPPLQLPAGHYRLALGGTGSHEAMPSLRAELAEHSATGWGAPAIPHFRHDFAPADLADGTATAEFDVPPPANSEAGDRRYDLTISHLGGADVNLESVELRRDPPVGADRRAIHLAGRKKLVLIGNCQCSVLVQAFNQAEALNRSYLTKYHFVQLQPNLYEFARRDIEDCDVLLVQDIDLWNHFPLRDCVRPGAEIIKFPLVRFASLWPFDGWNGPGDREALLLDYPNQMFPFFDGLLARLRREIPDKVERFKAYRELEGIGVVNYRRIHALEERRLLKVDQQYGCRIGEFTLDNFHARRVFHTTVRPNWQGFNLLIRTILKAMGIKDPVDPLTQGADALLRIPQVPVHPKVAQDLGVKWADERTRYLVFGQEMTWEDYIRRYIDHYG
ncbi:MAG TPA: WcbI family polysaccharide biosynthesis putative acetyltransferase [Stellaceae bacterium]|jgi:hypothetical protein|nr:WcbI family polysaccharide biosynthesis putative acetyltransferase [Stellaceae bacterium]